MQSKNFFFIIAYLLASYNTLVLSASFYDDKLVQCRHSQHTCIRSGLCIPDSWVCDGELDCFGGTDEENCPTESTIVSSHRTPLKCGANRYACMDNTSCIPSKKMCDAHKDCADGSDEFNCPSHLSETTSKNLITLKCKPNQYACMDNSHCILHERICDNFKDCLDGSDEADCPTESTIVASRRTPLKCRVNRYACMDNTHCIPNRKLCDGYRDCSDGSDEANCDNPESEIISSHRTPLKCRLNRFACIQDFRCIPNEMICDGRKDCSDGSDEINCRNVEPKNVKII